MSSGGVRAGLRIRFLPRQGAALIGDRLRRNCAIAVRVSEGSLGDPGVDTRRAGELLREIASR
jgi:hypothetical protein